MTRRPLNDEDQILWRHATRQVTPLDPALRADPAPKVRAVVRRRPVTPLPMVPAAPSPQTPSANVAPPASQPFNAAHGRRLKRGDIVVDAVLDLHGLTEAAAHAQLAAFLNRARALGNRTILVITGKGRGGQGVLKRRLGQWVAGDFAALIAGVFPAHARHGGGGAFYVVLRAP